MNLEQLTGVATIAEIGHLRALKVEIDKKLDQPTSLRSPETLA